MFLMPPSDRGLAASSSANCRLIPAETGMALETDTPGLAPQPIACGLSGMSCSNIEVFGHRGVLRSG